MVRMMLVDLAVSHKPLTIALCGKEGGGQRIE